jgi:hypothetical protein
MPPRKTYKPRSAVPAPVERLVSRTCAWCGAEIPYSGKGRPRAYCSKAHRNRAWEIRTAAARAGDTPAAAEPVREVVERTTTVQKRIVVPGPPATPTTAGEWTTLLAVLALQLHEGRLGREHWHHARIYTALAGVLTALDQAHPGGLDRLTVRRR